MRRGLESINIAFMKSVCLSVRAAARPQCIDDDQGVLKGSCTL